MKYIIRIFRIFVNTGFVSKKRPSVCPARQGSEGGGTPAIAKHTEVPSIKLKIIILYMDEGVK